MKLTWTQIDAINTAMNAIDLRIEDLQKKAEWSKEQIKGENVKSLENGLFYERHRNNIIRNHELILVLVGSRDTLEELLPKEEGAK